MFFSEKRYFSLIFFILLVFSVLSIRLFKITIVQKKTLSDPSKQLSLKSNIMRGTIYSSEHNALAISLPFYSLYIDPSLITQSNKFKYLKFFQFFGIDNIESQKFIKSKKRFHWIQRMLPKKVFYLLKDNNLLNAPGIGYEEEYKRVYPYQSLASHILGFTNLDNKGISGLEYSTQKYLAIQKNNAQLFGYDVVLTININLQKKIESIMKKHMQLLKPDSMSSIIMEAETGNILAMSSFPSFNPNYYNQYSQKVLSNTNIENTDEPGSTFKPLIMTYLFDENLIHENSRFFSNGSAVIHGFTIRESSRLPLGNLTPREILMKSSNIGMAKASLKLDKESLYHLLTKLNLNKKTNISLPGESSGLIRDPQKMSQRSVMSIAFGQEIGVTPIQLVSAFTAIANKGYKVSPRIIDHLEYEGKLVKSTSLNTHKPREQVYTKLNANRVLGYMRDVVKAGTARRIDIKGSWIAAKTGTAQIFDPKTKTYSKINTSLIAIYRSPVTHKQYILFNVIRSPDINKNKAYGSTLSAPIIKQFIIELKKILQNQQNNN